MRRTRIPGLLTEAFKGNYESPPAGEAAAAAGLTTLNIASATKTDPNSVLAAESSLGTTSKIVADTNHGSILDSGLDGCQLMTNLGSIPSDTNILHVRLYIGTVPTEDPGGSTCRLEIFVAPTNSITNNQGYHAGHTVKADTTHKLSKLQRAGYGALGSVTLTGDWVVVHAYFAFNGTTLAGAQVFASAQNGNFDSSSYTTDSSGTFSAVWLGLALSQAGNTPSGKPEWDGVTLEYEWIERTDD